MTTTRTRTRETAAREPVRESAAPTHGRTRVRQSEDIYGRAAALAPEGWVYQWNVVSVLGEEKRDLQAQMSQLGFTAVPAERHEGIFLPAGTKGEIVIGGLRLEERPIELELEARNEDRHAAVNQVRGSRQQFGLQTRTPGFEGSDRSNHSYVHANTFARSQYEAVDLPAPKHQLAVDE
jgi:hypothetical protein